MQLSYLEIGLVAALATYRLTVMLNSEIGPGRIFVRFRTWIGITFDERSNPVATNWRAEAVLCFYCLSMWISTLVVAALVLGAFLHVLEGILIALLPFALSGVAVYLKKAVG